jgi:hypothetical protein
LRHRANDNRANDNARWQMTFSNPNFKVPAAAGLT